MNETTSSKPAWSTYENLALAMRILLVILAYFLSGMAVVTTIADFA